jgi:hypothetical protein
MNKLTIAVIVGVAIFLFLAVGSLFFFSAIMGE